MDIRTGFKLPKSPNLSLSLGYHIANYQIVGYKEEFVTLAVVEYSVTLCSYRHHSYGVSLASSLSYRYHYHNHIILS